jgi:DNA polymerase III subunit epsilon
VKDVPASPRRAARRLSWTRVGFAALDFETTGLDVRTDSVISFGVVPVRSGRILLAESTYQTVFASSPLTGRSIAIHGLLPEDLADSPPMEEARPVLREALQGCFVLAWAAEVEAAFLAKVFGGGPRPWLRRTIDVLGLAILADRLEGSRMSRGSYALSSAAARLGVPVEQPHHAFDDALTTAQLFLVLASRLARRGYDTPKRLIHGSLSARRPVRLE